MKELIEQNKIWFLSKTVIRCINSYMVDLRKSLQTPKVCCIECKTIFRTNHFVRHSKKRCIEWKKKNGMIPKGKRGGWNKGLTKMTSSLVKKGTDTYRRRYENGEYTRRTQTDDIKKQYWQDCKFKFNVYNYPEIFDLNLLDKFGWYHPVENPSGVSRDHIISVSYGWKNGIDSNIINHIANCKLMIHLENNKKNNRSDLLLEELLQKIHSM